MNDAIDYRGGHTLRALYNMMIHDNHVTCAKTDGRIANRDVTMANNDCGSCEPRLEQHPPFTEQSLPSTASDKSSLKSHDSVRQVFVYSKS